MTVLYHYTLLINKLQTGQVSESKTPRKKKKEKAFNFNKIFSQDFWWILLGQKPTLGWVL